MIVTSASYKLFSRKHTIVESLKQLSFDVSKYKESDAQLGVCVYTTLRSFLLVARAGFVKIL